MDEQGNPLEPLQRILHSATHLLERTLQDEWENFEVSLLAYQKEAESLLSSTYIESLINSPHADEAKIVMVDIQRVHSLLEKNAEERQNQTASELRQILTAGKALDAYGQ
jgi:hypothetical protein